MLDLRELSDDMLLARPERLTMDHRHADGKFDQVRAWLMAAERERTPAGSGTGCEPVPTREAANALCNRLRSAGGSCVVLPT